MKVASPLGEHMSQVLADAWDTRVTISEGKRKGKIIIEFAGSEDLQRLADLLLPGEPRRLIQPAGAPVVFDGMRARVSIHLGWTKVLQPKMRLWRGR